MQKILYVRYEIVVHFTSKLNKNIQHSIVVTNTVAIGKIQH